MLLRSLETPAGDRRLQPPREKAWSPPFPAGTAPDRRERESLEPAVSPAFDYSATKGVQMPEEFRTAYFTAGGAALG
jgi:hypothetical protein